MYRKIAVLMGSDSDFGVMKNIIPVFKENNIDYDFRIISAHRTPDIAADFAKHARDNGYDAIIAGAGMSAHLAGVLAAFTATPIIGVPIKSEASGMDGMDALHSVIQMPPGIPVATVGIDHSEGAAWLACKMLRCTKDSKVNILFNKNEVDQTNLEKVTKALSVYNISNETSDLTGLNENEIVSKLLNEESESIILNLTELNIEKILGNTEKLNKCLIVEVPQKSSSKEFNSTNNKIFERTQEACSVAFVGINSYQNAAHVIARFIGVHNMETYKKVASEHSKLAEAVIEKDRLLQKEVNESK